jgi:fimbrial chaperone protein
MTKLISSKLFLIVALLIPSMTFANFTITPVKLQVHKDQKITNLTLTNNSNESRSFQLTPFKIVMEKGVEQDHETKDLFVSPLSFKIAPGKTQTIRVAVKENASFQLDDKSYRISVQELPRKLDKEGSHVQVVTKLRIPLTITGNKVEPDLE